MKYVNYNPNTSEILGYYDKEIHGNNIPQPYVEITDKQWQEAINHNYNYVDVKTKALSYKDFRKIKQIQVNLIAKLKADFNSLKNKGMLSKTINKLINSNYTDLMNMQSLLAYMNANNITTTKFRCYDNSFVDITKEQLQSMINELIAFGLEVYQRKWTIENVIQTTTERDSLLKLKWNEELEIVS